MGAGQLFEYTRAAPSPRFRSKLTSPRNFTPEWRFRHHSMAEGTELPNFWPQWNCWRVSQVNSSKAPDSPHHHKKCHHPLVTWGLWIGWHLHILAALRSCSMLNEHHFHLVHSFLTESPSCQVSDEEWLWRWTEPFSLELFSFPHPLWLLMSTHTPTIPSAVMYI